MTTTELIALLKEHEFGGASGRPREISFDYHGLLISEPSISIDSTGDGLFSEICLALDADKPGAIVAFPGCAAGDGGVKSIIDLEAFAAQIRAEAEDIHDEIPMSLVVEAVISS